VSAKGREVSEILRDFEGLFSEVKTALGAGNGEVSGRVPET